MSRGFLTFFFAMLLAGCGGGGAFTATTATTTPGTGTTTNGNATLSMKGQIVIPQGQKSTTLTFTFRNENGTPITDGTLTFTLSGSARVGGKASGSSNTDSNGDARVTIEDTVSEAVILSVTPTAPNRTFTPTHLDYPLYFSPVINAFISNNGQPANGTAAAKLTVRIQGQAGNPFVGVPTALAFSPKSFAVAVNVPTETDSNGMFVVDITDTYPETSLVYPNLGGYVLEGLPVTFTASTLTLPASVSLTVSGSPVLADGAATADLTVIARDMSGTPIADADVALSSSSGSAVLGAARGKTGSNGVFKTTISNSVVENVYIAPTVANVQGAAKIVVFAKTATTTTPVSTVEVSLNGNDRPANGTDAAILTIFARNASGEPVVDADVSLRVSGGSAVFSPDSGKTDNLGRFVINVTDKVAETFSVTPVVSTVVGATKTLTFNAIPSSSTAIPASVAVTAANNNQAADGQAPITLNVVVRDANNIPLSGVDVILASDSSTALLTAASGKTNAGGVFTTTVKNTKAETFTIKASAGAARGETTVTFGASPNVTISQITLTDNNKLADGKEIITVTALVRDAQNQPAVGIPMVVAINANTAGAAASAIPDKSSGVTGAGGEFIVKLTDTVAETFTIGMSVSGTPATLKRSGNITFIEAASTILPTSLELLTSSPQLASEGKADGVVLTAILKDKNNNPYKGGEVRFSSNSGTIQPIPMGTTAAGITNDSGQAQARLTTEGNPINRDITVTVKSGELTKTLVITVNGTVLSISGTETAIKNSKQTLSLFLKDSAGKGVSNQKLKIVSSLSNTLNNSTPVTDGSGVATVELTAINAGDDVITVSLLDASNNVVTTVTPVTHSLKISDDNFTVVSADGSSAEGDVALGVSKRFTIHWDQGGLPRISERINISATRGSLTTNSVITKANGEESFYISSNNAGPTVITVAANMTGGPSKILQFDFVASNPTKLDLQADPTILGVNIGDNKSEQSTIIAVVRDSNNNLVKGKRIEFSLTDITGGSISPSSAITDSFGRATIVYTAGASPSADKGVSITGTVADTPSVKATVQITVARRQAFIILGTGDKFIEYDLTKYKLPYTALVTDVNGNPVKGATVDFTVIPTDYTKGWWKFDKAETKWVQYIIVGCANEDINKNSILDVGEDINNNGHLDPRNIATLADASGVGSGNAIKITTNENGFADLNVLYPKNYAYWTDVQLIARTVVGGTESQASTRFQLKGTATDFAGDGSIPGETSPFGIGVNAGSKALGGYWIDETNIGDINGNGSIDTKLPATCQFAPELNPEKVDSNLAVFK